MVDAPQDVEVEPTRVAGMHEAQLVDVREPYEWQAGRIARARHIELARLAEHAGGLQPERPIVFYCRIGARSAMAAYAFRRAGYDAYSMAGGLEAWQACGLPLDGVVAPH